MSEEISESKTVEETPQVVEETLQVVNRIGTEPNYIAPDGSKFWRQAIGTRLSQGLAEFAANIVSNAQFHARVEEVWVIKRGGATIYLRSVDEDGTVHESITNIGPGDTFVIDIGVVFQITTYEEGLTVSIATSPPWDDDIVEAINCEGKWTPTV